MFRARTLRNTSALFYKRFKKNCSSSIVELYKHLEIFKNTREVREAPSLIYFNNALGAFFYFFNICYFWLAVNNVDLPCFLFQKYSPELLVYRRT